MEGRLIELTIDEFLFKYQQQKKKIILYGAGLQGELMLSILQSNGVDIDYFCDKDEKKQGILKLGKKVLSLKELQEYSKPYYLIITISALNIHALMKFLEQSKIVCDKIQIVGVFFDKNKGKFFVTDHVIFSKSLPWFYPFCYDSRYVDNYTNDYIYNMIDSYRGKTFINGILIPSDCQSKYINVKNGERVTVPILSCKSDNHIYIFGNSVVFGYGNEDKTTICSYLQSLLLHQKNITLSYQVHNKGVLGANIKMVFDKIMAQDYMSGDIILLCMPALNAEFLNIEVNQEQMTILYFQYLKKIMKFCNDHNILFWFIINPEIERRKNKETVSPIELHIRTAYTWPVQSMVDQYDIDYLLQLCAQEGIPFLDLNQCEDDYAKFGELFIDTIHLSPGGSYYVADKLAYLIQSIDKTQLYGEENNIKKLMASYENVVNEKRKLNYSHALYKYIEELKNYRRQGVCGAIVMNCNPFTKGHRYLIEYASKQVDYLYLFILEEEKSFIPFLDRLNLVQQGVCDLKNVIVLKSGSFIISSITFPEYFTKQTTQNIQNLDCSNDLAIFGEEIAPVLNITKRFVGAEPHCMITNSYNEQMKRLLPLYEIEVIEIDRYYISNAGDKLIVSASLVRKLIQEKDFLKIKTLVPETTYDYLLNRFNKDV